MEILSFGYFDKDQFMLYVVNKNVLKLERRTAMIEKW